MIGMDAVYYKDAPMNKKGKPALKKTFSDTNYVRKTISRPFFCHQFLRKLPFFRTVPQA
jgi:hypothetical protein